MNRELRKALMWAGARQALLGTLAVGLSLPPLFALCRAIGVETPSPGGLAILGGSAVLGFAGSGVIGVLLSRVSTASSGRGIWRHLKVWAALAGAVWGLALCTLILPVYLDAALDDLTDAGAQSAIHRFGPVLDHPTGAVDQAWGVIGELAQAGAARLPALALLGWTLLGPILAASLEARPPRKEVSKP